MLLTTVRLRYWSRLSTRPMPLLRTATLYVTPFSALHGSLNTLALAPGKAACEHQRDDVHTLKPRPAPIPLIDIYHDTHKYALAPPLVPSHPTAANALPDLLAIAWLLLSSPTHTPHHSPY